MAELHELPDDSPGGEDLFGDFHSLSGYVRYRENRPSDAIGGEVSRFLGYSPNVRNQRATTTGHSVTGFSVRRNP